MPTDKIEVSYNQLLAMKAYHLQMAADIDKLLQTREADVSTSGSRSGKSEKAFQIQAQASINLKKSILRKMNKK